MTYYEEQLPPVFHPTLCINNCNRQIRIYGNIEISLEFLVVSSADLYNIYTKDDYYFCIMLLKNERQHRPGPLFVFLR